MNLWWWGDGPGCGEGNLTVCVWNYSRSHPWRKEKASWSHSWGDELRRIVPVGKERSNKNQCSILSRGRGGRSICCDTRHIGLGGRRLPKVQSLFLPGTGPVGRRSHLHVTQEATSLGGGMGSKARGDELWGTQQPPWSQERWKRAD